MTLPVAVAIPGPDEARLLQAWEPLRREVVVVRRCADVSDVLAAAGAGLARAVVLGADLPGCDTETVEALRQWGTGLLVLLSAGSEGEQQERRWRALGATRFATSDRPAAELAREIALSVSPADAPTDTSGVDGRTPVAGDGAVDELPMGGRGRVVAVWGPSGSCGRTTVAVNLAAELAETGQSVLLVDADTRGASVGQFLGLLDEAPALLAAVRSAADGRLDTAALARHAPVVAPGLTILAGASDPWRWSEVRPAALRRVLEVAGFGHDWTIVDLPGGADDPVDGHGRDGITSTVLEAADLVLVVGAGDPVGLQRLVQTWSRLPDALAQTLVQPVVCRVRTSAAGSPAPRRTATLLRRLAGIEDVVLLPHDDSADAALLAGRSLLEHAPRSPLRRALSELASRVEVLTDAPELPAHEELHHGFDPLLARS